MKPVHHVWSHGGGKYETLLELGQGGMATAFLARALGPGDFQRLVVLKRLTHELSANPDAVRRFLAEARVAARLHHANVVGTHQIEHDAVGPFIVLDYVEGGSVDELLTESLAQEGRPLPWRVVLRIALDALAGLRAVHEATDASGRALEILHRDISLQNLLVGVHDGVTRLSDFGVAKSALSATRTDPGCFVGKLLYMAPEYLLQEPVGPTLDIYALGLALWIALAGDDPWTSEDTALLAGAIVREGVPSLDDRADAPPELCAVVARACARDPAERFQSAREMTEALEQMQANDWAASHDEVSALVGRLLAGALRARREALAQRVRTLSSGARATDAERGPTLPSWSRSGDHSGSRRRLLGRGPRLSLAVALGLLVTITLAMRLQSYEEEPLRGAEVRAPQATAETDAQSVASMSRPPTAQAAPEAAAAPELLDAGVLPPDAGVPPGHDPQPPRAQRTTAAHATLRAAPGPRSPSHSAAEDEPDEGWTPPEAGSIRRTNPYR